MGNPRHCLICRSLRFWTTARSLHQRFPLLWLDTRYNSRVSPRGKFYRCHLWRNIPNFCTFSSYCRFSLSKVFNKSNFQLQYSVLASTCSSWTRSQRPISSWWSKVKIFDLQKCSRTLLFGPVQFFRPFSSFEADFDANFKEQCHQFQSKTFWKIFRLIWILREFLN